MVVLTLSLVAPLLAGLLALPAEIVRLKDGSLVHGEIVDFDESAGFTLVRADTGGRVRVRWDHLSAAEARRIKESRGFTGEEVEPYLVNVVHLVLKNGTTETGVLLDDGHRDAYTLRRLSGTSEFPRRYVQSVENGRAEGLEIYGPDELYMLILQDLGTPTEAAGHFKVAVACEGARLYERSKEHYLAAGELDPAFKPDLIASRLARIDIRLDEAAETAVLDEIRRRLYRRQFDQAAELAASFRSEYPQSRQLGDLAALEGEIRDRRREYLSSRIISDYFSFLGKSLTEITRTDGMTLGTAMELAENTIHQEIMDRLSASYGVSEDILTDLWEQRRGGSLRTSAYGTGTFILGEERALDWDVGDDGEPADETVSSEDADLEERIEEVLRARREEAARRQSSARKNRLLLDEGLTPDEWWNRASLDDRERWLLAYYAETSGHLEVIRAKPRACRTCSALGYITVENERGEIERATCPTCKNLKQERIVSFR